MSMAYTELGRNPFETTSRFIIRARPQETPQIFESKKKHWQHLNKGAYKQGRG